MKINTELILKKKRENKISMKEIGEKCFKGYNRPLQAFSDLTHNRRKTITLTAIKAINELLGIEPNDLFI